MFRYYPPSIKVLAVKMALEGLSFATIRERLRRDISQESFARWTSLFEETRAIVRDPALYDVRGRPTLFNREDAQLITEFVTLEPSLFVDEIREKAYDATGKLASPATIQRELHDRLQLTLKKACVSGVNKCLQAKARFMAKMKDIPSEFFVFTDESAICDRNLLRTRQRSKKGLRTTRKVPKLRGKRYSILPAIGVQGVIALDVLQGGVKRKTFESFLKHKLLPRMNSYPAPNSILVLDNAAIHKGGRIARLCRQHGVRIEYLPTYCPELNPIELGFGVIKMNLRRTQVLVHARDQEHAIRKVVNRILVGPFMTSIWASCGYNTPFGVGADGL